MRQARPYSVLFDSWIPVLSWAWQSSRSPPPRCKRLIPVNCTRGKSAMARKLSSAELEGFATLDWNDLAPRLSGEIRSALESVLERQDGAILSRQQCLALANCEDDDLLGLLVAADTLRRDLAGNIVT